MKKHLFYPTVVVIILLLAFVLNACTNAGEGSDNRSDSPAIPVDSMTRNNNFAPAIPDSSGMDTTRIDSSY